MVGNDVHPLDQFASSQTARRICAFTWIDDDQRHFRGRIVKHVLFSQPVIAEIVAMVRGEDDYRIMEQVSIDQKIMQPTDVVYPLA